MSNKQSFNYKHSISTHGAVISCHRQFITRQWEDIPHDERIVGYWKAIANNADSRLNNELIEIVYAEFNGKWVILRMGMEKSASPQDFLWLGRILIN